MKRKEKTHSDRPSAAERDARVLAFHQNQWDQVSGRDPAVRSLRLLVARFDLAKYLLDTYPPDSVRTIPQTVPACLSVLAETRKHDRFQIWPLYQQAILSLEEAVMMGGPTAFWRDLKVWEQQGMRARTTLKEGVLSFAEVYFLRRQAEKPHVVSAPKPDFLQKVNQSFDFWLITYDQKKHDSLEVFLLVNFDRLISSDNR